MLLKGPEPLIGVELQTHLTKQLMGNKPFFQLDLELERKSTDYNFPLLFHLESVLVQKRL